MRERFERFSHAIFEISHCWHKLTAEEMEKYGLKGSHSIYLLTMLRYPAGITAPTICELCSKDKSDVSRMMSILEKKGLVIKEGGHQNRYGGVFKLTAEGKKAAEFTKRRATLAVELAGRNLTEETRAEFYQSLESIALNLRCLCEKGLPTDQ